MDENATRIMNRLVDAIENLEAAVMLNVYPSLLRKAEHQLTEAKEEAKVLLGR